jgi:uncharacterized protein
MPAYDLGAVETRILGCLIEKERVTPENYPLSLNSLTNACNQSTNRDPVVSYDEKTVETGADALREKKLATVIFGAGSRVPKYRHKLLDHFNLDEREIAILAVLMLRGPQTPGELRGRTDRMCTFGSLEAVEACLAELAKGDAPLVRVSASRPGQKERRYIQLLSAEAEDPGDEWVGRPQDRADRPPHPVPDTATLEQEVASLRAELQQLREEFTAFRKQFDPT